MTDHATGPSMPPLTCAPRSCCSSVIRGAERRLWPTASWLASICRSRRWPGKLSTDGCGFPGMTLNGLRRAIASPPTPRRPTRDSLSREGLPPVTGPVPAAPCPGKTRGPPAATRRYTPGLTAHLKPGHACQHGSSVAVRGIADGVHRPLTPVRLARKKRKTRGQRVGAAGDDSRNALARPSGIAAQTHREEAWAILRLRPEFTIESHEPVRRSSPRLGLGDVHADDPGPVRRELLAAARR